MAIGYILIKSKPGRDIAVLDALKKVPYVTEVAWTGSAYDIVVRLKAPTAVDIGKMHFKCIREITGVEDSLLMIAHLYEELPPTAGLQ